jgi:cyanate permease
MSRRQAWIVGATTLIGIGVGFVFLQTSALFFVASILIGIGLGLLIASLMSKETDDNPE